VEAAYREYRFDYAATALYEFTWYAFCDWYLELTKPVLQSQSASEAAKRGTRWTLLQILESLQRALHPLMPFITEEIWQRAAPLTGRKGPTVMLEPYPIAEDFARDEEAEKEIAWLQAVISAVRQIRSEMNVNPSRRIPLLLKDASALDSSYAGRYRVYLERLAGLDSITILTPDAPVPQSATALVGGLTILVPMEGLIDAAAELERLTKQVTKAEQDLNKLRTKLSNENFVRNAPQDVVAKDRERVAELESSMAKLTDQVKVVRGLLKP
jgi:valyl-tRNA synthetase